MESSKENIKYHKMLFIMNALDEGWKVKKEKDSYVFTMKHKGKKEVFNESYLEEFVRKNMMLNEKK